MTGPGRSPSSPWVQSAQGCARDGRTALFPPDTGMSSSNRLSERPSPNYFGIAVESSNPATSNPGPHMQKNWGSLPSAQSSLPSPKLQLYSQESVSEGLVNLLRTESEIDKGRRESALQRRPSNGQPQATGTWSNPSHSYVESGKADNWKQGSPSARGSIAGKALGSFSQG